MYIRTYCNSLYEKALYFLSIRLVIWESFLALCSTPHYLWYFKFQITTKSCLDMNIFLERWQNKYCFIGSFDILLDFSVKRDYMIWKVNVHGIQLSTSELSPVICIRLHQPFRKIVYLSWFESTREEWRNHNYVS